MWEKLKKWSISEKHLLQVGVIAASVQVILEFLIAISHGGWMIALIISGIACAVVSGFISYYQSKAVKATKQKWQTLLSDSFGPLIGILIAACNKQKKIRDEGLCSLIQAAEGIAKNDIGTGRRRVSVFEVCDGQGPNARLIPKRGTDIGRNDRSTSIFYKDKDEAEGKEVWKKLIGEGISQCADIADHELLPEMWDGSRKREYRSYVSVRIDDVDKMYGMLTINSTEVDAFDEGDILELKFLAQLLAFGMHMAVTDKQKSYPLNSDNGRNSGESLSSCPTNC